MDGSITSAVLQKGSPGNFRSVPNTTVGQKSNYSSKVVRMHNMVNGGVSSQLITRKLEVMGASDCLLNHSTNLLGEEWYAVV